MKKFIISAIIILICGAFFMPGSLFEIQKNIDIFITFYKKINKEYVDPINPGLLMQAGIKGMSELLDPYTVFIAEETVIDSIVRQNKQLGGLGFGIKKINNRIYINTVRENSTAMTSGLKVGDELKSVGDIDIKNKSEEEIYRVLNGATHTSIDIIIHRLDNNNSYKILKVSVERVHNTHNSLSYKTIIEDSIAYIKIDEFSQHIGEKTWFTIDSLKNEGAKALILDLRDNPGGLLYEAVYISNIFLPKHRNVVKIEGKNPTRTKNYKTTLEPLDTNIPLAILLSHKSASASEIVAGVMQDYDRGVIIGEQSFGKGLVQVNVPLSYNTQLKVTIAKYYTPSGRCIQAIDYSLPKNKRNEINSKVFFTTNGRKVFDGKGIVPDIEIKNKTIPKLLNEIDEQGFFFLFARQYLSKNDNELNICNQAKWQSTDINNPIILDDDIFKDFTAFIISIIENNKIKTTILDAYNTLAQIKVKNPDGQYLQTVKNLKDSLIKQYLHQLNINKHLFSKKIIENIVHQCLGNKNKIIATMWNDQALEKAIFVLKNKNKYNQLLIKE